VGTLTNICLSLGLVSTVSAITTIVITDSSLIFFFFFLLWIIFFTCLTWIFIWTLLKISICIINIIICLHHDLLCCLRSCSSTSSWSIILIIIFDCFLLHHLLSRNIPSVAIFLLGYDLLGFLHFVVFYAFVFKHLFLWFYTSVKLTKTLRSKLSSTYLTEVSIFSLAGFLLG